MKTFLVAAVAVAVSGSAFAKDLKGSVMTDAEMDKITAGDVGLGLQTAGSVGANPNLGNAYNATGVGIAVTKIPSGIFLGSGLCTANRAPC